MSGQFFYQSFHFSTSPTPLAQLMSTPLFCIASGRMAKTTSICALSSRALNPVNIMLLDLRKQVEASKLEALKDNVKVPETIEDYCIKSAPAKASHEDVDMLDFDDDYYDYGGDSSESD